MREDVVASARVIGVPLGVVVLFWLSEVTNKPTVAEKLAGGVSVPLVVGSALAAFAVALVVAVVARRIMPLGHPIEDGFVAVLAGIVGVGGWLWFAGSTWRMLFSAEARDIGLAAGLVMGLYELGRRPTVPRKTHFVENRDMVSRWAPQSLARWAGWLSWDDERRWNEKSFLKSYARTWMWLEAERDGISVWYSCPFDLRWFRLFWWLMVPVAVAAAVGWLALMNVTPATNGGDIIVPLLLAAPVIFVLLTRAAVNLLPWPAQRLCDWREVEAFSVEDRARLFASKDAAPGSLINLNMTSGSRVTVAESTAAAVLMENRHRLLTWAFIEGRALYFQEVGRKVRDGYGVNPAAGPAMPTEL